jgi:hypothetical protein
LLNQNKEAELLEAKARYGKTLQNYNNFENNATAKDTLTTNENTKYLNDREDHENAIITNAKQTFEDLRNQINTAKDQKLSDLEAAKKATQEKLQADTLDQEKQFEAKANEVNDNIKKSEAKALSRLNERATVHGNTIAKIQKVQNDLVSSVENNLRTKDNLYKEAVAQIYKKADVEKKNYEEEQKRVQKEYDIELKKSIMTINRKLEADIKSL